MALLNHKEYYILMSAIITLAASTAENVMQRSGVRLSVCLSVPSAHTQRDSPGGSTRRGQRTFPSDYYEDKMLVRNAFLVRQSSKDGNNILAYGKKCVKGSRNLCLIVPYSFVGPTSSTSM